MRKLLCLLLVAVLLCYCNAALAWGESNADLYENAIGLLKESKFTEAGEAFIVLGSYNDSPRYAMYCNAIVAGEAGLYSVAVENLKSLDGFLDSSILATYYAGLSWEVSEDYEHAAELLSGISLYRDVATRIAGYPALIKAREYRKADENEKTGNLDAALSGFKKLGDYEDSAARATSLQAQIDERDAAVAEAAKAEAYAQADQAEKDGKYEEAYDGFVALGDYSDSKARAEEVRQRAQYAKGMSQISIGSYKDAYATFKALEDFEDSTKKVYALGLVDFSEMRQLDATTASFLFHDKYGIINFADNRVVIPQWDSVIFIAENCFKVQAKDLYGLIDRNGNELSPIKWYDVSRASEGFMVAVIREKDEAKSTYSTSYKYTYYLVDVNGKTLTPAYASIGKNEPSSSSSVLLTSPTFSSGLIRVQSADGKWGFIDKTGEVKIPISYAAANDFSNDLAAVKDSCWGYINPSGEFVIEPQFSAALDFDVNERAEVRSRTSWHVINKAGNIVYFEGQPFDEIPEGTSEEDNKLQALNAIAEHFGIDPESEELVWMLAEETYGMEGIDWDAFFEAGDVDAALAAINDIDAVLDSLGISK